jgi:phosphoribosyl-AMP cyclohydrolase / phosphoribosyl-ATP pyrophosphohydrolase
MNIEFGKYADGLVPAVVQDQVTRRVLMVGFMNPEALDRTVETGRVTFYSRSKERLWTKGETSGNFLEVHTVETDCDNDTLLIKATPSGPICHSGAETCFGESNDANDFLYDLERLIRRRKENPVAGSYTSGLFAQGLNRVAQKFGEEAIEAIIASTSDDKTAFVSETADLLYHLLVLLTLKNVSLNDAVEVLRNRSKKNGQPEGGDYL